MMLKFLRRKKEVVQNQETPATEAVEVIEVVEPEAKLEIKEKYILHKPQSY